MMADEILQCFTGGQCPLPIVCGGYVYGTDSYHICFRSATAADDAERMQTRPDATQIIAAQMDAIRRSTCTHIPPVVLCEKCRGVGHFVTIGDCDECCGTGEVECDECGHIHDCETCDGEGRTTKKQKCQHCGGHGYFVDGESRNAVVVFDMLIPAASIFQISKIPNVRIGASDGRYLVFTNGTYSGIVSSKTPKSSE